MQKWETSDDGWQMLPLSDGWIFSIDPAVNENKGFDVFLSRHDDIITVNDLLTTHGNLKHATRMCEKLKSSGKWKKYLPAKQTRKKSKWQRLLEAFQQLHLALPRLVA